MHPHLHIERTTDPDGGLRIRVAGELDLATVPLLSEELSAVIDAQPGTVRLDLCELQFIDARGLQTLLIARQRAQRNATHLEIDPRLAPAVQRLLDLTRTTAYLVKGSR